MVGLERGTVALEPHQSEWKRRYEREVERLESIAGDRCHGYEHIGSTAVEGLAAKPVIDLLAVVDDLSDARTTLVPMLEKHGYEHRPDGDVRGRLFLARDRERTALTTSRLPNGTATFTRKSSRSVTTSERTPTLRRTTSH